MKPIEAILFEPVGCLAEFGADEFDLIISKVFGRAVACGRSGSEAYWDFVRLMDTESERLTPQGRASIERYELEGIERARAYEDVSPALLQLKDLGVTSIVASSLSESAVAHFLDRLSIENLFADVWSRESAGGVKQAPLMKAMASRSLEPQRVMFITDTAEGLRTAKAAGTNAILMMNDPDEAMKLTTHEPAGGIVSLHELPDFVRFVAAGRHQRAKCTRE